VGSLSNQIGERILFDLTLMDITAMSSTIGPVLQHLNPFLFGYQVAATLQSL
jgi:hypothetical protein